MKKFFIIAFFCINNSFAQVGIATTNPNPSTVLDIVSTDAGIMIPRVALTGSSDITTITNGNVESLLVYNTQTISDITPGYYYWDGTSWRKLKSDNSQDWSLSGNSGTNSNLNFIGTSDDVDLIFKRNGIFSGKLHPTNTSFGVSAFNSTSSGDRNTAFGSNALKLNSTGILNNAFGYNALSLNTTGTNNNAFGSGSLSFNTTGNSSCAFGISALHQNTTGANNNAFGNNALHQNISGSNNCAFGTSTLTFNSSGTYNTAFGNFSLQNNTTGINNTAFGSKASKSNTLASNNTAIGYYTLYNNTTGNNNTVLGYRALYNSSGNNNIAIGFDSGWINTSGSNNVFIGYQADAYTGNLTNAIAIGYNAKVEASNTMVLGGTYSDAVNVGIGITLPAAKLHIIASASDITPAIIEGCNVFADNDEATNAGVPVGGIYRTATGVLMIRY